MQASLQGKPATFARGTALHIKPCTRINVTPFRPIHVTVAEDAPERLRLHNLSPWEGSRRLEKRKGRGYGAGQGGTCGFGNRGQNARSGPSVRPGFEGGQMPLYRKLPKLRGIAGGMSAGLPKYVVVNLDVIAKNFEAGETVSLETLQEKRVLNLSGREAKLPLKVLGDGELAIAVSIKAAKFSSTAAEKVAAAGGSIEEVAGRVKWTKKDFKKKVKEMQANGLDYFKVAQQKRTDRAINKAKKYEQEKEARKAVAA